jgi:hypothetical protein
MSFPNFFKKPLDIAKTRPLHCVFYSHSWSVYLLEELKILNPKTDIILELALESNLCAVVNPTNKPHKNILGLLQGSLHLQQLGARFKGINAPLVLAPQHRVAINLLLSAFALVSSDDSSVEKAIVLVDIHEAKTFIDAYCYMSAFSIVWDVADYPNASLPDLAELLVNEQYLTEQSWAGIYLCNHKQRQLLDSEQRKTLLADLINEFPFLKTV